MPAERRGIFSCSREFYLPLQLLEEGEGVVSTLWRWLKQSQLGANPLAGNSYDADILDCLLCDIFSIV
jgi:hypothetical protein